MRGTTKSEGVGFSPDKTNPMDFPRVNPNFFSSQAQIVIQKADSYNRRRERYSFLTIIKAAPSLFVSVNPYGKTEDKYSLVPFIPQHLRGEG